MGWSISTDDIDSNNAPNFTESELAREAGASTVSVREFLIGFSRFGLIEKKPNQWC